MQNIDHIAVLGQWAEWGRACSSSRQSRPDWSAVDSLIEAAKPRLMEDSRALRELLQRSSDRLKFTDPLLCDLGLHRWLARDREEAYSDWLAWVLEQLRDAAAVLRVLGVQSPQLQSLGSEGYRVEREVYLKEGAPGYEGRIDLLIRFGKPERCLLGVEVKTWDESYEKQRAYLASLRARCPDAVGVLVAIPEVPEVSRCEFQLRRWRDVALALRREVAISVRSHGPDIIPAMMCGFVAAIEQNLLELGNTAARRASKLQPIWLSPQLKSYLLEALKEENE